MGNLGEHLSVAVYPGVAGLDGFWELADPDSDLPPEHILEVPQLQASFEDRDQLRQEDREVLKALGIKVRGKQAWPLFLSYRPGRVPWALDSSEVRTLTRVLEQVLDVTPRLRDNPALLDTEDEDNYLVRVAHEQNGGLAWQDVFQTIPAYERPPIDLVLDERVINNLRAQRYGKRVLEADFFLIPAAIREGDERPYYPYSLLLVDNQSGAVLGTELLQPLPSLETMWGKVPMTLLGMFVHVQMAPRDLRVQTRLLYALLEPMFHELGWKLSLVGNLPAIEEAKAALMQFMDR